MRSIIATSGSAPAHIPVPTAFKRYQPQVATPEPMTLQRHAYRIALVEEFVGNMDFTAYQPDAKTKAAVKRELQIITEAAYRLTPEEEALCSGPNWTQYRGMETYFATAVTALMTRRSGTPSRTTSPS